jgi:hypothetical protein
MTTALARVDNGKLAKLLRLAFGSDSAGEIVAAVAAVKRLLAASDLDAHWLADVVERGSQVAHVDHRDHDDHDRDGDDSSSGNGWRTSSTRSRRP